MATRKKKAGSSKNEAPRERERLMLRPYFPSRKMRKKMVSWFSPIVLIRAAFDLLESSLVGSQIDTRELQGVALLEEDEALRGTGKKQARARPAEDASRVPVDYACEEAPFYFDFMADTGEGWDSTYTVAHMLGRDRLRVPVTENTLIRDDESRADEGRYRAPRNEEKETLYLPRGRFLVIGGDLVYPVAEENEYRNRFRRPFDFAWDWTWIRRDFSGDREEGYFDHSPRPSLYTIPANHDWYDSLGSFRYWFCNVVTPGRFGGWRTRQSRSYFALRLPSNWWILGFDLGLQVNIDNLQYRYFSRVIATMPPEARVILVTPEPHWVYGGVQNPKLHHRMRTIDAMLREFAVDPERPPAVWLKLAGDFHTYQHYEKVDFEVTDVRSVPRQIVSGGGGAFLHPTHGDTRENMRIVEDVDKRRGRTVDENVAEITRDELHHSLARYPSRRESKRLGWANAAKFILNRALNTAVGIVYLILGWQITRSGYLERLFNLDKLSAGAVADLPGEVIAAVTGIVLSMALWAGKGYRVGGVIHGILHAALLYGGFIALFAWIRPDQATDTAWLLKFGLGAAQFALGFVFGGYLIGFFLCVSLRFFSKLHNDAFAHQARDSHKNFLRLRVEKDGRLTIFPIAVPRAVTYAVPEKDEIDPDRLARILKGAGARDYEEWAARPAHGLKGDKNTLEPARHVQRFLIESPIVIDPRSVPSAKQKDAGGLRKAPRRWAGAGER